MNGMVLAGATATHARGASASDPFASLGADRKRMLEDGAKREGALMFYSSLIPNLGLRAVVDAFRKRYPFVDLQSWRGTEVAITQKTLAEILWSR